MVNPDLYLEDLHIGDSWTGAPIPVSEAEIVAFAERYDPQPFHVDPAAGAASPFGSLIASGWQVAALIMRQFVDARPFGNTPLLGLGVDELRWRKPVRPGDVLHVRREITDIRRSASRPDRGTVATFTEVTNQNGETVMTATTLTQMPARPQPG